MGDDSTSSVPDPAGRAPAPGGDLVGRTVSGKFAVEALLGRGAMGTVYRARQLALDKTVALKVLNRDLAAEPTFADRFGREARAASRLDHPNSIRVFDFGEDDGGLLYLVMEYVEGRDLRAILSDRGPLAPSVAADVLSQVLAALQVAHDMGVLHRDLKPENIMVARGVGEDGGPADVVKVCDFGIAKLLNQPSQASEGGGGRRTTAGIVVGTPEYMSPEQARGEAVDGRSDLYSVGVVLYELLAGTPPFDGTTPLNIVLKHIGEAPSPPSSRRTGVDSNLEAVCLRAIAKRPEERFQTAREMRRAILACVVKGDPASSAPRLAVSALSAPSGGALARSVRASDKPTLEGVAPAGPPPAPRRARPWILGGAILVGVGVVAATLAVRTPRPPPPAPGMASAVPVAPAPISPPAATPSTPVEQASPDLERPVLADAKVHHRRAAQPVAPALAVGSPPSLPVAPSAVQESSQSLQPAQPPLPPPTPVAAAAPVPSAPSAPLPAPLPAPPAAAPPPYDLSSARVDVGPAGSTVGVTSVNVSRTIGEAAGALSACYRAALPRLGSPEGRGSLHVETDGAGVITEARLGWGGDPALAACTVRAVLGRRIANVDTGSASADVPLTFRAH